MWCVYLLKSRDKKWYYVGSTNRLEERICEHNEGKSRSTVGYAPLELVYKREFDKEREARAYEHRLKARRVEKEALIRSIENRMN